MAHLRDQHDGYRFIAASIAGPDRIRRSTNQDACGHDSKGHRFAAVVSDGVSSAPRSQDGSRIACASFLDYVGDHWLNGEGNEMTDVLRDAIAHADRRIVAQYEPSVAMATIVAFLVDRTARRFAMGNVGDSPGYHVGPGGRKICTQLDTRTVPRMERGKTVIRDGMPVMDNVLTAVLGGTESVAPHIDEASYDLGDCLVITTDGADFTCVEELSRNGRFMDQPSIDEAVRLSAQRADDDSTLVMLSLGEPRPVAQLRGELQDFFGLSRDRKAEVLHRALPYRDFLHGHLMACYREEAAEDVQVDILQAVWGRLDRATLIALLDDAARAGKVSLYNALRRACGEL